MSSGTSCTLVYGGGAGVNGQSRFSGCQPSATPRVGFLERLGPAVEQESRDLVPRGVRPGEPLRLKTSV